MRAIALSLAALLAACEEEAPPPRYPVTFEAHSDGQPLEGVQVLLGQRVLGTTNGEGVLHLDLTGPEGARVPVTATCPAGHRSPESLQEIVLRPVVSLDPAAQARGLQVTVPCPPERRTAVVIVRAGGQPNLPVFVDGRELARTDASGTAHVAVSMAPQTSFNVQLATASNPLLRPQDPSRPFTVPDADQVFVYDQPFQIEQPARVRVRRPRAPTTSRRPLPVKIESNRR
ncbi:MAG: hypothetical protein IT378_02695 [Sandaracinaceae bacterium]|nr:hypothetical protein [Sandaracinaceae bacterium]